MIAKDFILEASLELQERTTTGNKFWKDEELYIKLVRAYREIQVDLPCFISNQAFKIKEGIAEYHTKHYGIKGISLYINNKLYNEQNLGYIFSNIDKEPIYNLTSRVLTISPVPQKDAIGEFTYSYYKELSSENDYITLPLEYMEGLRLLFLSFVFEKSPRNSKERDLAVHYLKRYEAKKDEIKRYRHNKKSVNKTYQRM